MFTPEVSEDTSVGEQPSKTRHKTGGDGGEPRLIFRRKKKKKVKKKRGRKKRKSRSTTQERHKTHLPARPTMGAKRGGEA